MIKSINVQRVSQLDSPSGGKQVGVNNLKVNEVMDKLYDMAEEVMKKGYYSVIPYVNRFKPNQSVKAKPDLRKWRGESH